MRRFYEYYKRIQEDSFTEWHKQPFKKLDYSVSPQFSDFFVNVLE